MDAWQGYTNKILLILINTHLSTIKIFIKHRNGFKSSSFTSLHLIAFRAHFEFSGDNYSQPAVCHKKTNKQFHNIPHAEPRNLVNIIFGILYGLSGFTSLRKCKHWRNMLKKLNIKFPAQKIIKLQIKSDCEKKYLKQIH